VRIYLVSPVNPPSFWTYDAILPTLGKRCLFPNLSLPTVAGLTPPGHDVVLCDENVEPIDFDVEADLVGITGYLVHKQRVLEIAAEFRRRGRFVVVGGPFASLCPEELRGRCDVVFVDEAEETWPRFLRDFESGCWRDEYRPDEKADMTRSPMPRFDLLQTDRYHAMTVQFARGCPFTCEFCDIIVVYGRRPRTKAVAQVMAEIQECHRLGAKQVFLVDDNFIGNKKLAKELLREISAWGRAQGHPLVFNTEVSLDVARDPELLELMREANFISLFIGIESPRVESLAEARKHQNTRADLVESVHRVQAYGLQVQAGMIVGFDHDDASIFEEQLAFLQAARIPVAMAGMLQAMPKTPLHARVAREGRLLHTSSGDAFVMSNIEPMRMSRLELYRGYRRLVHALYSPRHFHERALGYLLERGRRIAGGQRLGARELRLFARVLWATLAAAGPRRAAASLRLMARALLRRPSVFPEAVSLALIHKGLSDYVGALDARLASAIQALEREARAWPDPGPPA
jgi:radical SAM superfamily enzyme YgiQ (UPF0313 family)